MREVDVLDDLVGTEVAVSNWIAITQNRIDTFAEATLDHQPHHHAAGVPAAGDDAAVDGLRRRLRIDVKRLRIELRGEVDDLGLGDMAFAQFDHLAREKILEVVGATHACPPANAGCAMKRRR